MFAIDPETIWMLKGTSAPGAIDMDRRARVMDAMGIDRQLVFPSGVGMFGMTLATSPFDRVLQKLVSPELMAVVKQLGLSDQDAASMGEQFLRGHNDWCRRVAKIDRRLRPVAALSTTSIEAAMAEAEELIGSGIRAVMMPTDCPPGGKSPAHADLDPFWRLFAEADVPILLHIAGELNLFNSTAWGEDVPLFEAKKVDLSEIGLDPYTFSVSHFGAQNFITTMVLGGVFERHPDLRVGVIELSSHWVGSMAENLTFWVDQFAKRYAGTLSLTPSEYLNRNVRVSSFFWEPVDKYIERWGLEDVYVFASDYPHFEGGMDTARVFADRLKRLGPEILEKFFVTNGELLLPA